MTANRRIHGIVAACMLFGWIISLMALPENPELGSRRARQLAHETAIVKYTVAGALAGFTVGLVLDLAVNGLPHRGQWRKSWWLVIFAVVAFAVFTWGVKCLWVIIHLPPPNF